MVNGEKVYPNIALACQACNNILQAISQWLNILRYTQKIQPEQP
jgi:hypothetical protein